MHWETGSRPGPARASAFEIYLRTGRRVAPPARVERKFNPWHDPDDGRFTFAGTGRYFPGDGAGFRGRGGSFGGAGATGDWSTYGRISPRHPRNHSVYTVKPGDTLSRIAALRKGLNATDLALINGVLDPDALRVGQRLILPNQEYLDAGRRAKTNYLDLAFYIETHDGRLPPDLTKVPSIEEQLNSNWRSVSKNGYDFRVDVIKRTRRVRGQITLGSNQQRSRQAQVQAGGADRRATDDGGHYVAARFNGPRDAFNHFAQDANFNRGAYRTLEDSWAKEVRAGRRVFVDIVPRYDGPSLRPRSLTVTWYIDGERLQKEFPNERKRK